MANDSDNSKDEMVYIAIKDEYDDEGDKMALIYHVSKNYTWIIDIGCSRHMTRDKTNFEHFEQYGGSVRFGNNEPCCIKGKGRISLKNEIICDIPIGLKD